MSHARLKCVIRAAPERRHRVSEVPDESGTSARRGRSRPDFVRRVARDLPDERNPPVERALGTPPHRSRLAALTGLRFIAAMAVVLFHTAPPSLKPGVVGAVIDHGYIGVTAFFVLSGFILAWNYMRGDAPVRWRAFWAARVARIYPVYLVGLVLALPHFLYSIGRAAGPSAGQGVASVVSALTLTQAWVPSLACQLNCPGWSLSAEAFFYLAFPLIAALLVRQPPWRVLAIAVGAGFVTFGAPLVLWQLHATVAGPDAAGLWWNPAARLPEFLLGVAMGRLYRSRLERRRARAPWGAIAAASMAAVVALCAVAWHPVAERVLTGGGTAVLFALLILALARGAGRIGRLLAHPVMLRLGEASYALYILHVPLMRLVGHRRAAWACAAHRWRRGPGGLPRRGTCALAGGAAPYRGTGSRMAA